MPTGMGWLQPGRQFFLSFASFESVMGCAYSFHCGSEVPAPGSGNATKNARRTPEPSSRVTVPCSHAPAALNADGLNQNSTRRSSRMPSRPSDARSGGDSAAARHAASPATAIGSSHPMEEQLMELEPVFCTAR